MSVTGARTRSGRSNGARSESGGGSVEPSPPTGAARTLGRTPALEAPQPFTEGSSHDPFEREAATAASRVISGQPVAQVTSLATGRPVRGAVPGTGTGSSRAASTSGAQRVAVGEDEVQRVAVGEEKIQRVAVGAEEIQRAPLEEPPAASGVLASLRSLESSSASPSTVASSLGTPGPGQPVPSTVRAAIEPRLGVSLAPIEVHRGADAAAAAANIGARAFTYGRHIYLGEGESPYDVGLMAHEATHAVQQGAVGGLIEQHAPEQPQRLGGAIRRGLARYARHIPGYALFTVIIGVEPLTGERVERNAQNLVGGLLGLIPFGTVIFDKLVELGVIGDALAFVNAQLSRFDLSVARIERMLSEAWDEMDFIRLDPFAYNLGILRRKFGQLLADIRGFVGSMVDAVVQLIRNAVVGVVDDLLADEPAWSLIKKVLGRDPLRDEPVEADTAEILADFLVLIGRETELEQMRERGTLQEAADWIDTQLETFYGLLGELGAIFTAAWEAIQPANLPNLLSNMRELGARVVGLLGRAWDFAWEVASKVLELTKQALLNWLSEFAHEAPGFHLLTVIIGRNPFTDEEVPRTAENLIRGFITLLPGGDAAYDQLAESGVIGQAAGTIEGAMSELGISWALVRDTFLGIWDSLSINDLVNPIGAFLRIRDAFGEPLRRIFEFIRVVLTEVIRLILALMNFPGQVLGSIIDNAAAAYEDIKNDPIQFFINLLMTVKEGFSRFLGGIFGHLLNGMRDWLFRGLRQAGIEPPSEWTLESALDLVMQVLGLTVDRLWQKLAERIGQDRVDQIRGAMDRLSGIWIFVRDVQERGPAAVWEHISSQISGLWDTILQQARDWVMETIVQRVTARLLSMLDPTGVMAVVNSFVAFFNAIQSAIEYIRDLLDIVDQWVGTLAAVARGDVEPGAARLELGLISAVPVAIGFLANQVGLGNVGDRIQEIIGGLREMVDRALDWLLDQAERLLQQVMSMLGFGAEAEDAGTDLGDVRDTVAGVLQQQLAREHSLDEVRSLLAAQLRTYRDQGLTALYLGDLREDGTYPIVAEASPPVDLLTVMPRVAEGGGATVRTLVRLTLAGDESPFATEQVEVEVVPSEAEVLAYVRDHHGTTGDHGVFLGWKRAAVNTLTRTEVVEVPVGAAVDAAAGVLRARARRVGGVSVAGRRYSLVRRIEEADRGRATHGGAVLESTGNVIDAQFWSVGQLTSGSAGDNSTHAEPQFIAWYNALDPAVRGRVRHIHLQNVSYSPCWTCAFQLGGFLRGARNAAEGPVDAVLVWGKPYLNDSPVPRSGGQTTDSALGGLASAGWSVTPATVEQEAGVEEGYVTRR